jgi:hypothetical protein
MTVAVGEGSPFHVAYGTEGAWLHATGEELGNLAVTFRWSRSIRTGVQLVPSIGACTQSGSRLVNGGHSGAVLCHCRL